VIFPWLTVVGLVPLIGSIVVAFLPNARPTLAKQVAFGFSLIPLVLTVLMALQFKADSTEPFQFVESHPWIPAFGISYSVGIDGIALVLIAMSTVLVPVVILAGWNDGDTGRGSVKG
jgi:NADH-quinone oxidoreductase subunit M